LNQENFGERKELHELRKVLKICSKIDQNRRERENKCYKETGHKGVRGIDK